MIFLNEEFKNSENEEHIFFSHVLFLILPNKFHHSPNGGWRQISTAVRLKKMGVSPGFPDIFILGPPLFSDKKYPGCAIELKTKTGKSTPAQREWIEKFIQCGFLAKVCVGAVPALEFLCENGYVKRNNLDKILLINKEVSDEINREIHKCELLGKKVKPKSLHYRLTRNGKRYPEVYSRMVRKSSE